MGYPTSVFSPAARSNGQTIDASHVNDLQTEVLAVEAALLGNVTTPLNVTAASSFATVQINGGSTFAVRPVAPPPHAAIVYLESTMTIGSSVTSTVAWNAQQALTNSSIHSTGSNPTRLTPQSTGLYSIVAQIGFTFCSSGLRGVVLRDSTGTAIAAQQANASTGAQFVNVAGTKYFDALGGFVTCEVNVNSQSTLSISTGVGNTWMSLVKL